MYEKLDKFTYTVYKNKTKNLYEWKEYNSTLQINDHDLLELKLDLRDVTFQGTENFI